ncbi:hypothetical protein [Nocardia jejuensis]|uniref:hypothetical protein n=1 Tax=Nocardia jejuensis TaxID=328049 RepID=UPI0008325377|nr:hypothetical protein [Nocardia jejuensis]
MKLTKYVAAVVMSVAAMVSMNVGQANAGAIGNVLDTNHVLAQGDYLTTNQGTAAFAILQGDGNFCVYRGTGPSNNLGGVWCSGTSGHSQVFAVMQGDGNFVIYRGTGPGNNQGYLWGTGGRSGASGFYLQLNSSGFGHSNPNLQVVGFPASGWNTCYWSSDGNCNLGG